MESIYKKTKVNLFILLMISLFFFSYQSYVHANQLFINPAPTEITLLERVDLYNDENLLQRTGTSIAPQTVKVIQVKNTYFQVQTWLGAKWINPTKYVNGKMQSINRELQLKERTDLYQNLKDTQKVTSIAPQTVQSVEEVDGWYKIKTWLGYKWVKPTNMTILTKEYTLQNKTLLYNENKVGGKAYDFINPQTVKVLGTYGEWKNIQTWIGPKWILPIEGNITTKNEAKFLGQRVFLYEQPTTNMKTTFSVNPQKIIILEELNKNNEIWYRVQTWIGPMWIKGNEYTNKYTVELNRWTIFNNGTKPVETTKGFNDMLSWVHANGGRHVYVPEGIYLIKKADPSIWNDPSACVNMSPNLTFELNNNAIIQKETNNRESYSTLCIGYGDDNVTLKGGTYKGDKDTHDYSTKDLYGPGTHENGIGISVSGAKNLTIDGIKAINFTGDGLGIGGHGTLLQDLYEGNFESGSLDTNGNPIADATKIRMKGTISLVHDRYKTHLQKEPYFEMPNGVNIPYVYEVFFYKADGSFHSYKNITKPREIVQIPESATSFRAVFKKTSTTGVYAEFWNKTLATNVTVKNSEFAFNRRQGITVGGADGVLITNNKLHDIKGTAPQSGIDVEGGYGENGMLNQNITISYNEFYNNAVYDIILYDGNTATIEGNRLASKGTIGLAISPPFTGAVVKNNHFDGSRIFAYHDVHFTGNKMNDSITTLEGPNITIDGMEFTNSTFGMTPIAPNAITVKNITTYNSDISIWKNPMKLENVTMYGPKAGIVGPISGHVFENLKIIGYDLRGMSLSAGTYNNCLIESAVGDIPPASNGVGLGYAGKYTFNQCTFKMDSIGLQIGNANTEVEILNSTVEMTSKSHFLKATNAKNIKVSNNIINSTGLTGASDYVIMIGDYWTRNDPFKISNVTVDGNKITTNIVAKGISTTYAGIGAPSYTINNNTLTTATMDLKANDTNLNNVQK